MGDPFEYIFHKQVTNPDGSITVYAAHQRLSGPTVGDRLRRAPQPQSSSDAAAVAEVNRAKTPSDSGRG